MTTFELDPKEPTPPSTIKVVVIAAVVALVIGCLPALISAVVIAGDFNEQAVQRSKDNCQLLVDQRKSTNARIQVNRISIQSDIDSFQAQNLLYKAARDNAEKQKATPEELDPLTGAIDALDKSIIAKRDALAKSVPYEIPNCEKLAENADSGN